MATLEQEVWLANLQMNYQERVTFLNLAEDLTQYLDAGGTILNLAHAGADPTVLVNNAVYPLTVTTLTENPSAVALDHFTTVPTVVRELQKKQFAYDKQKGDLERHNNAIRNTTTGRAAYNIAPASNAFATPVIATTGAVKPDGSRAMTFADIVKLGARFTAANVDPADRVLVLSAEHHADLQIENIQLYNALIAGGAVSDSLGFKVEHCGSNPVFDSNTGIKAALGAAVNPAAQKWQASVAFQKSSFGKVMGTAKMFSSLSDPLYSGDIISFQQFFMAVPIRAYGFGAIYSGI